MKKWEFEYVFIGSGVAASTVAKTADGVVDENLRVHGTENLYVCSNAVFPTGSAVNPTLALTAMSMRLGDHLNAGGA
jgi:choline dehydrogenase-like flavoprotein